MKAWFSYDPIDGAMNFHDTEEEALEAAEATLEWCRDEAGSSGWPEEVDDICCGRVTWSASRIKVSEPPPDSPFDYMCEYALLEQLESLSDDG